MTTFDSREKAFEDKYAHDAEMMFKVRARRNRLFGEWLASDLLGLSGDAVKDYGASVIKADLEEEGDDDVMRKVNADLQDKAIDPASQGLEKKLAEFMLQAKTEVLEQ